MQDTLIDQGISLMIYGMGTVFVFLAILVFATGLMSKLVNKYAPAQTSIEHDAEPNVGQAGVLPHPHVLEAIREAISQHRNK